MKEQELYNALQSIAENLSLNGDRTIYGKMLVLLNDMQNFLHKDLQIEYPIETCGECIKIKVGSFDF